MCISPALTLQYHRLTLHIGQWYCATVRPSRVAIRPTQLVGLFFDLQHVFCRAHWPVALADASHRLIPLTGAALGCHVRKLKRTYCTFTHECNNIHLRCKICGRLTSDSAERFAHSAHLLLELLPFLSADAFRLPMQMVGAANLRYCANKTCRKSSNALQQSF